MEEIKRHDLRQQALKLAVACRYEVGHSQQVCFLALRLFDLLAPIHRLGEREKSFLEAAALLHDIGWIQGRQRHHKASQDIIIGSDKILLNKKEKVLIGLTARYHRRALPKSNHKYFSGLDSSAKSTVRKIAALLRFADGLDRSHTKRITGMDCRITPKRFVVFLSGTGIAREDITTGKKKADLFEDVYGRAVVIKTASPVPQPPASPHHPQASRLQSCIHQTT